MTFKKRLFSALFTVIFSSSLIGFSSPAAAAWEDPGNDVILDGVTWSAVGDTTSSRLIDDLFTDTADDAFDGIGSFQFWDSITHKWRNLYCGDYLEDGSVIGQAVVTQATDESGDMILVCGETQISNGLTATVGARFYAEGDMVRLEQTLTNQTGSDITYDYWSWGEYGDADTEADYFVTDSYEVEIDQDGDKSYGTAWGLATGADWFPEYIEYTGGPTDDYGFSGSDNLWERKLANGQSVTVATFVFHNADGGNEYPSYEYDTLAEWAADEFATFSGRLNRGLENVSVVNWGPSVYIPTVTAPATANIYRADKIGSVYFVPGSSKLSIASMKKIKAFVAANPSAIYKVTGYVQKIGSAKNDATLSLARATAVETYLTSIGAGVTFTVVIDVGLVPTKAGLGNQARRATLFAMTPVVQ